MLSDSTSSTMERPSKRPRLSFTTDTQKVLDDLDLDEARARNDLRLKSIFESIFERYEKDFTEVGDEIDLRTGAIVVNNGHLQAIDEDDVPYTEGGSLLFEAGLFTTEVDSNEDQGAAVPHKDGDGLCLDETPGADSHTHLSDHKPGVQHFTVSPDAEDVGIGQSIDDRPLHSDDDNESIDSLLDIAQTVPHASRGPLSDSRGRDTTRILHKERGLHQTRQKTRLHTSNENLDPKWQIPDAGLKFTTPTLGKSHVTTKFMTDPVRPRSPLGIGSLWALPGTGRKRRSPLKEEKRKRKTSVKKTASSPMVCDWSFAAAPDGSESDDPLQKDFQPSPTPKRSAIVRGKGTTPGRESKALLRTCGSCKRSFPARDYINHLRELMISETADGLQAIGDIERELEAFDSEIVESGANRSWEQPTRHGSPIQPDAAVSAQGSSAMPQGTSPTKGRRPRTIITPDEAKLIVIMRHVQCKKWKEIQENLPGRKTSDLISWNYNHWTERRADPPPMPTPWSDAELRRLENMKDQKGLSWTDIRANFEGRSHADVEFQLLRLWTGESWNRLEMGGDVAQNQVEDASSPEKTSIQILTPVKSTSCFWLADQELSARRAGSFTPRSFSDIMTEAFDQRSSSPLDFRA